jgi:3-isopropylmalate/(R)-2-methylmalate dehydratase small subunit
MIAFQPLDAVALPIERANFDTDQIVPARYLQKPRSDDFGAYLFRDLRFRKDGSEDPAFVSNQKPYRQAGVVVAARNFGCGSSREHAVWALYDYGIRAVIAPSFGDIFYSNALKNGLLPVVQPTEVVASLLQAIVAAPGSRICVDLESQAVTAPDGARHEFAIDPFSKHCLISGLDELDYTLNQMPRIVAFERGYDDGTAVIKPPR